MDLQMELAGGQCVHTHGRAFSTTGQCNERWRARPCNATQPPSLHLVLVRERRRPAGCQGTFPTGHPAIFPLSLWFLHWAVGTQGRHLCRLLSIGCKQGESYRASHSSQAGEPLFCQKCEAALFAPFLPLLGLLLLSGPDCLFSQLC